MMIVDTHAHASPFWFEPIEVLLFQMNRNGVAKTMLVAINGQTDEKYNRYLIECAQKFPGRFAPIILVDPERADAPTMLKHWASQGAAGVRLKVAARSPGSDPLSIWRACADLGLVVSCQVRRLEEFASDELRILVAALPNLIFIIEHLGKPNLDEAAPYPNYKQALNLARFPNVYIKVGGLGEICRRPYPFREPFYRGEVPPFIKMAYDAFGAARMMWGSNYPPSSQVEGYRNTLGYLDEYLDSFCSAQDQAWIFGKTALTLSSNQRGVMNHE